jgi:hypothetical protein
MRKGEERERNLVEEVYMVLLNIKTENLIHYCANYFESVTKKIGPSFYLRLKVQGYGHYYLHIVESNALYMVVTVSQYKLPTKWFFFIQTDYIGSKN